MVRIVIIHGWEGKPSSNWFPWLREELETRGVTVEVPQMPNTEHPKKNEWVSYLSNVIGEPDVHTFLIGHSLGGITILRYLESLEGKRIGGAVLVAGFSQSLPNRKAFVELDTFFTAPVNFARVRRSVTKQFIAIHSDNDPYVPILNGEIFREKCGAKLIIIHNGGHLNASDGYVQFPEALLALESLMV